MPLTDIALVRNPANGRFNFQWKNGDVVTDTTCEHEVMSRLVEKRAQWWADEDGTHGSRIHTVKTLNGSAQSNGEAYAREALQPMIDRGAITISRVTVQASTIPTARFQVNVFYQNVQSGSAEKRATVFV
jgi:phage gp46-like protein